MIREKSFVLILLLELILVSASSFMSLGYVIFTSPESSVMLEKLSTLVYVGVVSESVDEFTQAFEKHGVNYRFYNTLQAARADFKQGLLDAVVYGGIDYSHNPSTLTVYLPTNSPKTSLTRISLKKTFVYLEKQVRSVKVNVHAPDFELISYKILRYNPNARYIEVYYVFTIPLILFLPALVAGSLSIDSVSQELEDKSILNLLTSPLSSARILLGKNSAAVFASITQCFIWIIALDLTAVDVLNKYQLLLLCTLYSIFYVNLGSIIALIFREMKASQIVYTIFSISSISLYSPLASWHPVLLENSPAYLLAQTALGFSLMSNFWQLMLVTGLVILSILLVYRLSPRLEKPI